MTRRDTYGGERGWQDGAGVSWTAPEGGGRQQWREREPLDPYNSPRDDEDGNKREGDGLLHRMASAVGLSRRGPKNYRRSDERIREDVCECLWRDPDIDAGDVSVEVEAGVVRLEGTVPVRRMKHRIEDVAADCPGVNDVENRIRIARIE
jgi:hypothetical protein